LPDEGGTLHNKITFPGVGRFFEVLMDGWLEVIAVGRVVIKKFWSKGVNHCIPFVSFL
jgi:hypothetical protein